MSARVEYDTGTDFRIFLEEGIQNLDVLFRFVGMQLYGINPSVVVLFCEIIPETFFPFHDLGYLHFSFADKAEDGDILCRIDLFVKKTTGDVSGVIRVGPVVSHAIRVFDECVNQNIWNL